MPRPSTASCTTATRPSAPWPTTSSAPSTRPGESNRRLGAADGDLRIAGCTALDAMDEGMAAKVRLTPDSFKAATDDACVMDGVSGVAVAQVILDQPEI